MGWRKRAVIGGLALSSGVATYPAFFRRRCLMWGATLSEVTRTCLVTSWSRLRTSWPPAPGIG